MTSEGTRNRTRTMTLRPDGQAPRLKDGVVGVVDALGFRGIYERHEPARVIRTLRRAKSRLKSDTRTSELFGETRVRVALFSDTKVMTSVPGSGETLTHSLSAVARKLGELMHRATSSSNGVPLLYRGCISVGKILATEEFFVGAAIDEAASCYEQADAAVVWLTPSAAAVVVEHEHDEGYDDEHDRLYFFEWSVPLKTASCLRTLVVNPLAFQAHSQPKANALDAISRRYLNAFGSIDGRPELIRKRHHTEDLMAAARIHTCGCLENLEVERDA